MLKDSILERLSEDERIRKGNYKITVRVWLAADGRIERTQLADSTGNRDIDAAIEQSLERIGSLREGPPIEMPQPVTLRIVSRG
jgi:outer membrane biosynthesis protein TonB